MAETGLCGQLLLTSSLCYCSASLGFSLGSSDTFKPNVTSLQSSLFNIFIIQINAQFQNYSLTGKSVPDELVHTATADSICRLVYQMRLSMSTSILDECVHKKISLTLY